MGSWRRGIWRWILRRARSCKSWRWLGIRLCFLEGLSRWVGARRRGEGGKAWRDTMGLGRYSDWTRLRRTASWNHGQAGTSAVCLYCLQEGGLRDQTVGSTSYSTSVRMTYLAPSTTPVPSCSNAPAASPCGNIWSDRLSGRVSTKHEKTDDRELTHDKDRRQDARTYKVRLNV